MPSKKIPSVSFVITTYNNREIISACIKSIKAQSFRDFEIIVVDDCSTDGTAEFIRKSFKGIKIISKPGQTGPSISRNLGIKATGSEFIAFLDSDVTLYKDWLSILIKELKADEGIGIIGGKLLLGSGERINSAGGALTRTGIGYDLGAGEPASHHNVQREVMYICSAAMLARRKLVAELGGFDETYFYGHEDTDLGWRVNLFGYRVIYNPDARANHQLSQTMKKMSDRIYFNTTKNRLRSIIKNYNLGNALIYTLLNKIITTGMIIISPRGRVARLKGLFWSARHLGDTLKERKKIQVARKKTDKQLSMLFSPLKLV